MNRLLESRAIPIVIGAIGLALVATSAYLWFNRATVEDGAFIECDNMGLTPPSNSYDTFEEAIKANPLHVYVADIRSRDTGPHAEVRPVSIFKGNKDARRPAAEHSCSITGDIGETSVRSIVFVFHPEWDLRVDLTDERLAELHDVYGPPASPRNLYLRFGLAALPFLAVTAIAGSIGRRQVRPATQAGPQRASL